MEGSDGKKQAEDSISEQQRTKLREKLGDINKKLLTMEWDKKRNQLNVGMETKYTELKEEHEKILAKINAKPS